ncbi:hypothetical protein INS49_002265 [Diaporthe citri]|uniref:uncharacterized protein n=1 Tax=Diaporthe citri TaxID=83186 RepID=UPI001C81E634|nr:uncharacterized protein INS49_002265 [Diaporthe citri]KAG6368065.1 hypothetical protein INS49_002265 [Diaporthe citri]
MPPSACDQKKADIIRLAENECFAETETAKAVYELKCLKVQAKYKAKKKQACRDLNEQELEELGGIKRLYEAEMEPIKVRHAEKLSEIREQYRIATPEAGLHVSATSETPISLTLVTAPAEAGNDNSPASSRSIDDTEESGDETDTSIPAIAPQATNKAKFTPRFKKRKRISGIFDSGDEEPEFSQNENKDEQDDTSDVSFPGSQEGPSGRALKAFRRPSTQRSGQNNVSSALATKTKNRSRPKEVDNVFKTRTRATSTSGKTDSQAEGGDEDEDIGSAPASQAPRRNRVRPGRPEPGKYRMTAKAWPV